MSQASKTYTLSDKQRAAVHVLVEGGTVAEAAEAATSSAGTVREWARSPAFRAALNTERLEDWNASAARLRRLVPTALDVLEEAMRGSRRLQAALVILKAAGLDTLGAPAGSTDPAEIEAGDAHDAMIKALTRL